MIQLNCLNYILQAGRNVSQVAFILTYINLKMRSFLFKSGVYLCIFLKLVLFFTQGFVLSPDQSKCVFFDALNLSVTHPLSQIELDRFVIMSLMWILVQLWSNWLSHPSVKHLINVRV